MTARRPFFYVFLFFALGILGEKALRFPFFAWAGLTAGAFVVAFLCGSRPRVSTLCLALLFVFLGAAYSQSRWTLPPEHVHYYRKRHGRRLPLKGIVSSEPQVRPTHNGAKTTFTLGITGVKTSSGWRKACGKVKMDIYRDAGLRHGDLIETRGTLHWPFNFSSSRFSYRDYLRRRGILYIYSVKKKEPVRILGKGKGHFLTTRLFEARGKIRDILGAALPQEEAGILRALLIGERDAIPARIKKMFIRTGTAHILAISGLHVGIVTGLLVLLWRACLIPAVAQFWLTAGSLGFYVLLTGGRASVIRASLMAVVLLKSFLLERETDALNSLSLAGFFILLLNPLNLWDAGFQLSFLSVVSIILIYPILRQKLTMSSPVFRRTMSSHVFGWTIFRVLASSFCVSVAAWLGVAGLIAVIFEIITPVTVFANLVAVPLVTLLLPLGLGLLLAGTVLPFLAPVPALGIRVVWRVMVVNIVFWGRVPGAAFESLKVHPACAVLYYILLACFVFAVRRNSPESRQARQSV